MNSYIVYVNSTYRDKVVVTANSEEEARQKVVNSEYDDIIDSEFVDHIFEAGMEVVLDGEDIDEDEV